MDDEALDQPPVPATLAPRWEAFEHGLLPIPKLIFPEGMAQGEARYLGPGEAS